MALLIEDGLVTDETTIVAPVHHLQVVDEEIPETEHDFSVDLIVTPHEVIECPNRRRPRGLVWEDLTSEKIEAIPVLGLRAKARGQGRRRSHDRKLRRRRLRSGPSIESGRRNARPAFSLPDGVRPSSKIMPVTTRTTHASLEWFW
nr:hypothetical protein [Amycolatopsis taiwanensis]